MCYTDDDLKNAETILLMGLGEICRILLRENGERITERGVTSEVDLSLNLVNAMVHGRDKKVGSYALFLACLFRNRQIEIRQDVVINMIEDAIKNNYNIYMVKVDRRTNQMVGESELVLKHVE